MNRLPLARIMLSIIIATSCLTGAATAQDENQTANPSARESNQSQPILKVYYLQHMDSRTASDIIQTLIGPQNLDSVRMVENQRLNSLIIQGPKQTHEMIEKTLITLDQESNTGGDDNIIRVDLDTSDANEMDVLGSILPTDKAKISFFEGGLIVAGAKPTVEKIKGLVEEFKRLRLSSASPDQQPLSVELIWASESGDDKGPRLQPELDDALRKQGFQGLKINNMIQCPIGNASGFLASSESSSSQLQINGSVLGRDSGVQISMEVAARRINSGEGNLEEGGLEFQSELTAKIGHWVIFGVAS
ncbi:MAG: hypothetical protein AAFP90_10690, partial [Planctomycetota bacterium]